MLICFHSMCCTWPSFSQVLVKSQFTINSTSCTSVLWVRKWATWSWCEFLILLLCGSPSHGVTQREYRVKDSCSSVQKLNTVCIQSKFGSPLSFDKVPLHTSLTGKSKLSRLQVRLLKPYLHTLPNWTLCNQRFDQKNCYLSLHGPRNKWNYQHRLMSAIKPAYTSFLSTAYTEWFLLLCGLTLTSPEWSRRDVIGILGTASGLL